MIRLAGKLRLTQDERRYAKALTGGATPPSNVAGYNALLEGAARQWGTDTPEGRLLGALIEDAKAPA